MSTTLQQFSYNFVATLSDHGVKEKKGSSEMPLIVRRVCSLDADFSDDLRFFDDLRLFFAEATESFNDMKNSALRLDGISKCTIDPKLCVIAFNFDLSQS